MNIKNEVEIGLGDQAILEFQLTGIQHAIKKAVMMRAGGLSELIDAEVRKAFSPGRIESAIEKQVEEEFQRSMTYGEGAQLVRQIVSKQVAETLAKLTKS